MSELPMPPAREWAIPLPAFYRHVYDTQGVPPVQELEGMVIFTPSFENLVIYGRAIASPYPEDAGNEEHLRSIGRFMGEWFSVACPEGEPGSKAFADCEQISAEEFSAAYERGWQ